MRCTLTYARGTVTASSKDHSSGTGHVNRIPAVCVHLSFKLAIPISLPLSDVVPENSNIQSSNYKENHAPMYTPISVARYG